MSDDTKKPGLTTGRARRALKVGSLTTQVGGNYLLNALKRPFQSGEKRAETTLDTHLKNAVLLVERSKELRGTFLKLMQMLSMRNDILPDEVLNVLSVVQSDVPPMPFDMIRERIETELGDTLGNLYGSFEQEAFAAASLGQVHRGTLKDGTGIVVKVQYPGVEKTVEQDLKNLKALLRVFTLVGRDIFKQPIDADALYREMEERLGEELDYENEARNTDWFADIFADDDEIIVPRVFHEFSARRVLTLEYIEGYKLADIMKPGIDQELKDWVALKFFRTLWQQILEFGVIHTDPHPGNYLITYRPEMAILDFGSVRAFTEETRLGYVHLARAILDNEYAGKVAAMVELGYLAAEDDAASTIEVLDLIFEPATIDRVYDPQEYGSIDRAMKSAQIRIESGFFRSPPPHSVFLGRALIGLDSYMQLLGTRANFHRLFAECVERAEARGLDPAD
jgi:predicted unusual protein kinase regulating ubiquinone biosynthesis (AarF/ABC1/UbiB family)